jgi:hypothetical protein
MGEATYYLKARFREDISPDLQEQITNFIKEGQAAYKWWQEHRGCPDPTRFWKQFAVKFPVVTEYLGDTVGGDCNNGLAGVLSFGEEKDIDTIAFTRRVVISPPFVRTSYVFQYSAYVWHLASWDEFATFLEQKFGASRVNWLSDEGPRSVRLSLRCLV